MTETLKITNRKFNRKPEEVRSDLKKDHESLDSYKHIKFHNTNSEKFNDRILFHLQKCIDLAYNDQERLDYLYYLQYPLFFFTVLETMLHDTNFLKSVSCDIRYGERLLEPTFGLTFAKLSICFTKTPKLRQIQLLTQHLGQ